MTGRRDALLWGLVGALSFLVLAQGYRLVTDQGPSTWMLLGVALVVWAVASVGSAVLASRLDRKRRV